jgi:hypothetical protein
MFKKSNNDSDGVHLQPLALTVVVASLGVACLLFSMATMGVSPTVAGRYQITSEAR